MYPQYLRQAGYYCTNNTKEDYNLEKPGTVWDDSSAKAHWKNRSEGQPFFAIFNFTNTHESQMRTRPHQSGARSGQSSSARLSPRHARSAPGLGPVLRQHHRDGPIGRPAAGRAAGGRTGGRHDRLLLRRSRLRDAAQQTVAVQFGIARAADRPRAAEVSNPWRPRTTEPAHAATVWWPSSISRRRCSAWPASSLPSISRATPFSASTRPPNSPISSAFADGWTSARSGALGARPAVCLHPQLHAASDLRAARLVHVRDADDAGLEATVRRGQAVRSAEPFLATEAAGGTVRSAVGPGRSPQPGRLAAAQRDPRSHAQAQRDWILRVRDVGHPAGASDSRPQCRLDPV